MQSKQNIGLTTDLNKKSPTIYQTQPIRKKYNPHRFQSELRLSSKSLFCSAIELCATDRFGQRYKKDSIYFVIKNQIISVGTDHFMYFDTIGIGQQWWKLGFECNPGLNQASFIIKLSCYCRQAEFLTRQIYH